MEHLEILNLLNEENNSKFMTRKWNFVNGQSNANFDAGNEIIYNIKIFRSNLCGYNNAYILVKCDITVTEAPAAQVLLKFCAIFTECTKKIDGTTINDVDDLDLAILYNLTEYSSSYSETTGCLWFYFKDKVTNFNN